MLRTDLPPTFSDVKTRTNAEDVVGELREKVSFQDKEHMASPDAPAGLNWGVSHNEMTIVCPLNVEVTKPYAVRRTKLRSICLLCKSRNTFKDVETLITLDRSVVRASIAPVWRAAKQEKLVRNATLSVSTQIKGQLRLCDG